MFCGECGTQVPDGTKFCPECGNRFPGGEGVEKTPAQGGGTVIVPPPGAGSAPPPRMQEPPPPVVVAQAAPPFQAAASQGSAGDDSVKKKGAAAFFSSPAGILLIVLVGLLVIAGAVVGIVLGVRGGGSEVDAATMDVWDEYETLLEDDGETLEQINMDPNALTAQQNALKEAQERTEALEEVLAETGGSEAYRANPRVTPDNTRDLKAAQLAAALAAYNEYVQKLGEFYGALIAAVTGNQLLNADVVNNLNAILADVQDLAAGVKKLTGKFMEGNAQVVADDFDPYILEVSKALASSVQQGVDATQAAEAQRIADEKAAAEKAAAEAAAAAAQYVTCPNCGGVGTVEGGDGRYVCGFCNGTGTVTRAKAATYNPADWRDY
jgi:zinc-ribbon domain